MGERFSKRFGKDRHRPEGDWVQTTNTVSVVGVQHREGMQGIEMQMAT